MVNQQALATTAQHLSKEAEFESLVLRYQNSVYNIALRMSGNPDEAQDLAQEAFVRAYRSFDSYRRGTSFDKWLYRIVTNLYIDEVRRRKRKPHVESLMSVSQCLEAARSTGDRRPVHSPETVYDREHLDICIQMHWPRYRRSFAWRLYCVTSKVFHTKK